MNHISQPADATYLKNSKEGDVGVPLVGRFGIGFDGQRLVIGRRVVGLDDDAILIDDKVLQEFDEY